jgi:hypothetical protein
MVMIILQLRSHPEDWLQRLGVMLLWVLAALPVLYIIYYIKNRSLKKQSFQLVESNIPQDFEEYNNNQQFNNIFSNLIS